MCGITGFIDFNKKSKIDDLSNMVRTLHHRGPDDMGSEIIETKQAIIGLAQARLSIIDLSAAGHQPMKFKHLCIVFNGEIYNYKEIKSELQLLGHEFSTKTDTEVILHSFYEWGIDCVQRFIGMFSIVIYDEIHASINVFRDRAGVKPFYYAFHNNTFIFGSELKALMAYPNFKKVIDVAALPNYFQYGYIAAPYSIFKDTFKLKPGHYLNLNLENSKITTKQYWSMNKYYSLPKLDLTYSEAKVELLNKLKTAFEYRMVGDVQVGVFLSGGYDSTAVASILQENRSTRLKTFTIGFEEGNNEAPYAKQTAELLGTDHTEYICTQKEAQDIISDLPFYYDEPFGDSSAIPTILVSRIAQKEVTVALSADGGDELFGGYNSYFKLHSLLKATNSVPEIFGCLNHPVGFLGKNIKTIGQSKYFHQLQTLLKTLNLNTSIEKAQFLHQKMTEKPQLLIESLFKSSIDSYPTSYLLETSSLESNLELAMLVDFNSYLPNDILTKVDRATMSTSLEGREPFLDHQIAEFAAQLPLNFKTNGQTGKIILKDIVHGYVSKEIMDRPKAGFSLPIYSWLRGDLSYLIDDYLSKEAIAWSGIFNETEVWDRVEEFKRGKFHYSPTIWYLLMFQMWWKRWINC